MDPQPSAFLASMAATAPLQARYDALSAHADRVQRDLAVALDLIEKLRADQDQFRENFSTLKANHVRLQEKHADVTSQIGTERSQHEEQIKRHESQANALKELAEKKDKEIEELRREMFQPKDVDLIRLKVIEEVDVAQKKRWRAVEDELEKYRNSLFKMRRDYEMLKVEKDRMEADHEAAIDELEGIHAHAIAAVESRARDLHNTLDALAGQEDDHRRVMREKAELESRVRRMEDELGEMAKQRENDRSHYESQIRNLNRREEEFREEMRRKDEEHEISLSKIARLETDLDRCSRDLEKALEERASMERELGTVMHRYEEAVHAHTIEVSDLRLVSAQAKSKWETERTDLTKLMEQRNSDIADLQQSLADSQLKIQEADRLGLERVMLAREEERGKITQIELEKAELEKKVATLKQRKIEDRARMETAQKEYETEIRKVQEELNRWRADAEAQRFRGDRHESAATGLSTRVADLELRLKDSDSEVRDLRSDKERLSSSNMELEVRCREAEKELEMVRERERSTNETLDSVRKLAARDSEKLKSTMAKERQNLTVRISQTDGELLRMRERVELLETTLLKTKSAYKKKVAGLAAEVERLKSLCEKLDLERTTLKKANDLEARREDQRKKEAHRRQSEFMRLLQHESAALSASART